MRTHLPTLGAAAALTLLLAACSPGTPADGPTTDGTTPAATASAPALTITDPWMKAADSGMTAAFGTLVNSSGEDVTIISAECDVAPVEIHEMVAGPDGEMVMQRKEGGVVVEAGSEHPLAPGGDHLMLMGLTQPVQPGDDVEITLTTDDGATLTFTAPARSFSGANEDYHGTPMPGDPTTDTAMAGHGG